MSKTYVDPPQGWKYGFPKPIPEDILGNEDIFKDWLVQEGYPRKEIEYLGDSFYCRMWEQ